MDGSQHRRDSRKPDRGNEAVRQRERRRCERENGAGRRVGRWRRRIPWRQHRWLTCPVREGGPLDEYETLKPLRPTDLTHEAKVMGAVGSSDYGPHVYFVAGGVLGRATKTQMGNTPWKEKPNPTSTSRAVGNDGVHREAVGRRQRVHHRASRATLPGDWETSFQERTAKVTPMAVSRGVHVETKPHGLLEQGRLRSRIRAVQRFSSTTLAPSSLSCASCNPDGQPPVAVANNIHDNHVAEQVGGAFLPAPEPNTTGTDQPAPWISDDGSRVFFDTAKPLVPQDTNGVQARV